MTDINHKRWPALWVIVFSLILIALVNVSWANPDVEQEVEVNTDVTTGDQIVGGDSSRAFGFSGSPGDVDINECLASTQWGLLTFFKQKVSVNKWCYARYYDSIGQYDTAAKMRCSIPEVRELFTTDTLCKSGNKVLVLQTCKEPEGTGNNDEDEERQEELYVAQQQENAYVREELATFKQQLQSRPAPRVTREVMQRPFLSDDQKARLRAEKSK